MSITNVKSVLKLCTTNADTNKINLIHCAIKIALAIKQDTVHLNKIPVANSQNIMNIKMRNCVNINEMKYIYNTTEQKHITNSETMYICL